MTAILNPVAARSIRSRGRQKEDYAPASPYHRFPLAAAATHAHLIIFLNVSVGSPQNQHSSQATRTCPKLLQNHRLILGLGLCAPGAARRELRGQRGALWSSRYPHSHLAAAATHKGARLAVVAGAR